MSTVPAHVRFTALASWAIAVGTVVAIAFDDGLRTISHTLTHLAPQWLALALAFELMAYAGYVAAYRSSAHAPGRGRLPLHLAVQLVVAGFGPFVALGGFSLDRRVLRAVHRNDRVARVQVLGLGVVEYALLAPAAWICALIMVIEGRRASPGLTLPWLLAVPPGFAIAAWASKPERRRRWHGGRGRLRGLRSEVIDGLCVLRRLVARPQDHPGAILGMGLYWAAEIACLGAALACFGVEISVPALAVAHATGYAASRRSLPLGGAGVTEALLTLALIWVHVPAPAALLSVATYRLINFLAPTLPGLMAHTSISHLLHADGGDGARDAQLVSERLRPTPTP
jgi:uncharacterized membrane protein YbhN (UPF0104 family)